MLGHAGRGGWPCWAGALGARPRRFLRGLLVTLAPCRGMAVRGAGAPARLVGDGRTALTALGARLLTAPAPAFRRRPLWDAPAFRRHPRPPCDVPRWLPTSRAPAPLPRRSRAAPAPRGAAAGGFERWRGHPGITNKKPDHVTNHATRSSLQISPVERLSKTGMTHTPSRESNSNRSYYKGRSPCSACSISPPVWGLCAHGRSCGIWHHWGS